jgi:nucleoside 2-deoxyribosyltransferase
MIYVASSWRNPCHPGVVNLLRAAGHEVYDFRAHADFHWRDIDPAWRSWRPADVAEALKHPIAQRSFACDMEALEACDALVFVMPCGRSAHLELGYAIGAGKRTAILLEDGEPELMWAAADWIGGSPSDLLEWLAVA